MEPIKTTTKVDNGITFVKEQSKIVFVKRKKMSGLLPGQKEEDCILKIGSGFKHNAPLAGLTFEEEARFLPIVTGVDSKSTNFKQACTSYWSNISKEIPYGEGLKLEIGLKYKSKEDFEKDKIKERTVEGAIINPIGEPINIIDYILWRYCLLYSRVANSIEDVGKSPKIEFYLFSKDKEIEQKTATLNAKREANKLLYSRLGERDWVDCTLRVLIAKDKATIVTIRELETMSEKEKDLILSEYAESNPSQFLTIAEDKNLEMKAFVEVCVSRALLTRIPNTDSISLDGQTLGDTLEQTVTFLCNPKNAGLLNQLKAQSKTLPS